MEHPGRGIEFQQDIEVDGETYRVHLLSPTRAIKLSVRISKIIGEPMASMAHTNEVSAAQALPLAVRALTQRLDEDEVISIIKAMVETCKKDNKPINFEVDFQGRLGHMLRLVTKVLGLQLNDFFIGLGEAVNQAMNPGR